MIAIFCKGCGALFYAVSRITEDDVLEIAAYAAQGHLVAKTNEATTSKCQCKQPPTRPTGANAT